MPILSIPCVARLVLGAVLWAAFWPYALAATGVQVATTRAGDVIAVHAQATLHAPLATVWGTLTDYERLPEFVPGMKTSRVIARKGATATVAQTGEARFLFFTEPIEVTVESAELPPHTIEVRRVAGGLRHLQGRYDIRVLLTNPAQVRLEWTGSITPESDLPPLIGLALMRHLIKAQFVGLVREIERRAAAQLSTSPAPPAIASP